jgi:CRP/FNR family transcriptional regulator, cyclic AMP receptor protein
MRQLPEARGISPHNVLVDRLHYQALFEYFPPHVRHQIFNMAVAKSFSSGDVVFRKGDEGSFFGAIMTGRVRMVLHSPEGKPLLMTVVDAGEIFGETGMLDGLPRTLDAVAETSSTILILQRKDFLPILMQHPEAMLSIIKVLCARVRLKTHILELIALQNLPGRLAKHLCRLAEEYGEAQGDKIIIRAGLSQADIGQQLATSRESVNKQLKLFVERGYISLNGEEIWVLDMASLRHTGGDF